MPLFAYCIARGFHHSYTSGTIALYKKRMFYFALISQIPYMLMLHKISGNIGVLWLACLYFLEISEKANKEASDYLIMYLLIAALAFVPVDYGLYGLGFTLLLYYFEVCSSNVNRLYVGYAALHILWLFTSFDYGIMQLFTLPSLSLIAILKIYDNMVKINRFFFYAFYPLHISVLLIIKAVCIPL